MFPVSVDHSNRERTNAIRTRAQRIAFEPLNDFRADEYAVSTRFPVGNSRQMWSATSFTATSNSKKSSDAMIPASVRQRTAIQAMLSQIGPLLMAPTETTTFRDKD